MEEAAQILEIETFIPLLLQVRVGDNPALVHKLHNPVLEHPKYRHMVVRFGNSHTTDTTRGCTSFARKCEIQSLIAAMLYA